MDPSLISKGKNSLTDVGSNEEYPVLEKRNLAGLVFFVILILLAAITGLVIYIKKKRLEVEREPLTNGPSMTSLQDK